MTAPKTRNWSANELPDFAGHRYHLKVHGEVETSATNYAPKLTEHIPQGFNPRILLLDLTIVETAEIGGQVVAFRSADYDRPTNGHQYDEVDILFEGNVIERIKVNHPKTAAAAAPKKSAASKAAKKGGKKKPAKKKPAKKKPAKKARKAGQEKGRQESRQKEPEEKIGQEDQG